MRRKGVLFSTTAIVMCVTISAVAEPFSVTRLTPTPTAGYWTSVYVDGDSDGNPFEVGDSKFYTDAGTYNVAVSGAEIGDGVTNGTFESFCIDVWNTSNSGIDVYSAVSLDMAPNPFPTDGDPDPGMGLLRAGQMARLLDDHWNPAYLSNNDQAVALQLALWEIVAESTGTYSLQNGYFGARGTAATLADGLLSELTAAGYTPGNIANYIALTADVTYQDYVVKVPLPGAVLLGLLGLGYAGVRLRRECV